MVGAGERLAIGSVEAPELLDSPDQTSFESARVQRRE
jgi:hypothetical protein